MTSDGKARQEEEDDRTLERIWAQIHEHSQQGCADYLERELQMTDVCQSQWRRTMKLMARITFSANEAELGIAALREHGFLVLTQVLPEEPDCVFAEAIRDEASSEGSDVYELSSALLNEVAHIIGRSGSVDDAGPIPAGHIPFEYETAAWRGEPSNAQKSRMDAS